MNSGATLTNNVNKGLQSHVSTHQPRVSRKFSDQHELNNRPLPRGNMTLNRISNTARINNSIINQVLHANGIRSCLELGIT